MGKAVHALNRVKHSAALQASLGDDFGERPIDGLDLGVGAEDFGGCLQSLIIDIDHGFGISTLRLAWPRRT